MTDGNLLKAVILVSEKAANIARAIRQEEDLLALLVREKKGDEKNPRFVHDFKTLADVLVQEVVKHDLGTEFPDLVGHIYGEESNEFSCLDGESLCLTVGSNVAETSNQLLRILGDERAADILAKLVHSTAEVELDVPLCCLPTDKMGIWIDPIDSTAEYISGGEEESEISGVFSSGLACVTVLIGAFDRDSGLPSLGVVNQPFNWLQGERWKGKIIWGVSHEGTKLSSIPDVAMVNSPENKVVILSGSESEEVKSRLSAGGFTLVEAAGAGYKLLCVATHLVSAYVLSKPSTFYWDTCGVQAVLGACDGGMVNYADALKGHLHLLTYEGGKGTEECCNTGGFIAYSNSKVLEEIVGLLTL